MSLLEASEWYWKTGRIPPKENLCVANARKLWFYIRIIYSALCRILSAQGFSAARSRLNEIRNSDIFVIMSRECQNDTFTDAKKKFMWCLLKSNKTYVILSVAGMMNFVKSNMRVLFARIKE